jgi:hypothetical protein
MVLLVLSSRCAPATTSPKRVPTLDPFGLNVAPFNTAIPSAFAAHITG